MYVTVFICIFTVEKKNAFKHVEYLVDMDLYTYMYITYIHVQIYVLIFT